MGGGAGRRLNFGATYGSGMLALIYYDGGHVDMTRPEPPKQKPPSTRETLLSKAKTDKVKSLIKELYRKDGGVGDGGTADAIRHEKATGELVGGKSHIKKGKERLKQINKLLKKNPNSPDRSLLIRLKEDIEDALGGIQ